MKKVQNSLKATIVTLCIMMSGILAPPSTAQDLTTNTEIIPLITYHSHIPFVTNKDVGLTYELASYLNNKADKQYRFEVRVMSRLRINLLIEKPKTVVVPWVNPLWFNDKEETKFLWTQQVLLKDKNVVVSRKDDMIIYNGPNSLAGLKFGGLRGHHYVEIDDYISKTANTIRIDSDGHISNFMKLSKGRIDVTITPSSAVNYFIKQMNLYDDLFISPRPHSSYNRRIFVNNKREDIRDFLDQALKAMVNDPTWQAILDTYSSGEK
ncbi:substrate-binding periplasmic protein [Kiloniella sp.]|uniref:substrate-binding periplasmic protein n=1 Tax=Kiloniella sp. TaxID=1938587 RepID=UPI003B0246C9